jgi:hypothetical protein
MAEAAPLADLGAEAKRRERVDAAQAAKSPDRPAQREWAAICSSSRSIAARRASR